MEYETQQSDFDGERFCLIENYRDNDIPEQKEIIENFLLISRQYFDLE